MTAQARLVLNDSRVALSGHSNELAGPAFRASWFAVVGLLRAVGYVLTKVDTKTDPRPARVVEKAWVALNSSRPKPAIFRNLIEAERNRFLKNYEHGIAGVRIIRADGTERAICSTRCSGVRLAVHNTIGKVLRAVGPRESRRPALLRNLYNKYENI